MPKIKQKLLQQYEACRHAGLPPVARSFPPLIQRYFSNISGYEPAEMIRILLGPDLLRVLIVGVGGGRDHYWLLGAGHEVFSLDICYQPDIEPLTQADMSQLPFQSASFDAIVIADALEHTFDDKLALTECWRVLGSGGALILNVPFGDDIGDHHVRVYTENTLRRLLNASGFVIETTIYRGVWPMVEQRLPGVRALFHAVNALLFALLGETLFQFAYKIMTAYDMKHTRAPIFRRLSRRHGAYIRARKSSDSVDFRELNARQYRSQISSLGRRER